MHERDKGREGNEGSKENVMLQVRVGSMEDELMVVERELIRGLFRCSQFKKFLTTHYSHIVLSTPAYQYHRLVRLEDRAVLHKWRVRRRGDGSR